MKAVDSAEVVFVVDNATDSLSSNPPFVETEFGRHRRRGMPWLSGKCLCCAAHGLSCLVTTGIGSSSRTLLFDTGPEEWVFERNVVRLGLDLGEVGALVLSHGQWDHGGAMPRALQMITMSNGGHSVPTYMHPDMFALRATKSADAFVAQIGFRIESILFDADRDRPVADGGQRRIFRGAVLGTSARQQPGTTGRLPPLRSSFTI